MKKGAKDVANLKVVVDPEEPASILAFRGFLEELISKGFSEVVMTRPSDGSTKSFDLVQVVGQTET